MIKYGGEQPTLLIHQLIEEIWESEQMPEEWSLAIICPIQNKKAYADDVDMISKRLKDLEEGLERLEKEAEKV
ncbi:hypothetical protein J437_LFUL016318 [Ladona fulva]|uniref:Uncharacterized protein n=1 Tax=Ladona fulva TaxID=123851 RepID=A0A8K0PCE1_LADFU|nr:hypothetical protein J437_LFUL016318 [Ladona fulva]